jgi:hypothetical protein
VKNCNALAHKAAIHCAIKYTYTRLRCMQQVDAAPKRVAKPAAAATTAATATAAGAKEPKKKATRGRSKLITPEVITAPAETETTIDTTAASKKRKATASGTTAAATADTTAATGSSSYDLGDVSSGDELPLPSKRKQAAVAVVTAGESGVVEVKLVKRRSQKGASGKHDAAFSVQELVQAQAAREAVGTGAGSGWD